MDESAILALLLHGNQLKRTVRTGWVQRGVPNPESVAAHTHGVAFIALVLAQLVDEPLDLGVVLALAVLHDLPEGLTTDIPTPAWAYLPPGVKIDVERSAMAEIVADLPLGQTFMAWWESLHAAETTEARLVHDADRLDMMLQALMYERQTGNQLLAEFWERPPAFHFPPSQALYAALVRQRHGA